MIRIAVRHRSAHGTVAQSGGSIGVSSGVGQGSSFIIDVPAVNRQDRRIGEHRLPQENRGGTGTVLIVEDERASHRTMQLESCSRQGT